MVYFPCICNRYISVRMVSRRLSIKLEFTLWHIIQCAYNVRWISNTYVRAAHNTAPALDPLEKKPPCRRCAKIALTHTNAPPETMAMIKITITCPCVCCVMVFFFVCIATHGKLVCRLARWWRKMQEHPAVWLTEISAHTKTPLPEQASVHEQLRRDKKIARKCPRTLSANQQRDMRICWTVAFTGWIGNSHMYFIEFARYYEPYVSSIIDTLNREIHKNNFALCPKSEI